MVLRSVLKLELRYIPFLIIMIACQLLIGRSAYMALTDRQPALSMYVYDNADTKISSAYMKKLEASTGLTVYRMQDHKAAPKASENQEYRKWADSLKTGQGLLVINENFDECVLHQKPGAVSFFPLKGLADTSLAREYITLALGLLYSEYVVRRAFDEAGISFPADYADLDEDTLYVVSDNVYEGFINAAPPYTIAGLFMLTAFLNMLYIKPARPNIKGQRGVLLYGMLLGIVSVFYFLATVLFKLSLKSIYGLDLDHRSFFILILIGIVSAMPALCFKDKKLAICFFVVWILLNMTVGGGLWNVTANSHLAWLLPVSWLAV